MSASMIQHLPTYTRRILVAGTSGSGKTTLAGELSRICGIPHIEIDALFHGPGWQERPGFMNDVERFSSEASWITEWQYGKARQLLAERADTLVWLDHPRWLVISRVIRRTAHRARTGQELWNGNREPGLWHAFTHREGIIRWAHGTYGRNRQLIGSVPRNFPHLDFIHLSGQSAAERWLEQTRDAWSGADRSRQAAQ